LEALDLNFSKKQGRVPEDEREEVMADGAAPDSQVEDQVTGEDVIEVISDEVTDTPAIEDGGEQMWKGKVAELEDRLLRVHADFDNFRKRTRQEKEELLTFANTKVVGDLLPVLDNFSLALQAAESASEAESIAKGVGMVYKQLVGLLENLGLREMEPIGQAFDPNLHEAVMAEAVEGQNPGTVIAVMRTGYYFKDKVLRPAMVKVSE
jgi:molecular chaperone GrpE